MELVITNQEEFDNRPLLPLLIKTKWLEALRSGYYNKGKHLLSSENKYCCLGVLCEIQSRPHYLRFDGVLKYDGSATNLESQNPLFNMLGSHGQFKGFAIIHKTEECYNLASINDYSDTFDDVIEVIEKYF